MQTFLKTPVLLLLATGLLTARAAEQTATVNESKINVRGQPSLIGEVVTQLQKGDQVTVLEQVKNDRAKGGEPTNWARIKLPANTPVWIYNGLVKDGAISATRSNLRAGPGDNYSVIGRLNKGDKIKVIRTMGDWSEIEAPTTAYAFVDASLLKVSGESKPFVEPPGVFTPTAPLVSTPSAATTTPKPTEVVKVTPPATNSELDAPTLPARRTEPLAQVENKAASQEPLTPAARPTTVEPPTLSSTPAQPTISTPPPIVTPPNTVARQRTSQPAADTSASTKRIVRREGIVRATRSIQAPTWYELIHPETKKTIDYLHEEKLGVNLKEYKGQKVIVSGEELIDPRWPHTPILDMETLDTAP